MGCCYQKAFWHPAGALYMVLSAVESVVKDYFAPYKGLGLPNKGRLVPLVCILNCDRAPLQPEVCIKTAYGEL